MTEPWIELYRAHQRVMRHVDPRLAGVIRARLARLAEMGHCDRSAAHRFTNAKNERGRRREWFIRSPEPGLAPGEPLFELPELLNGRLSIQAITDTSNKQLFAFSAMLAGEAPLGSPRTVAAHFVDRPSGRGGCGHALFHCHVGPTLEAQPRVRVPLPPVGPVGILDWLLAIVVPAWEPAPWPKLLAALGGDSAAGEA